MTSSETRTDSRKKARKKHSNNRQKGEKSSSESEARRAAEQDSEPAMGLQLSPRLLALGFVLLLIGGWMGIMNINRWYWGPPVFFLCTGWLAILLTARFLWNAGMSAAEDDDGTLEDEFWRPEGPQDELQREKRSLLKAIKEIEFDREMGKMSDLDAKELTQFYRARAIQIIKSLEQVDDSELSISEQIDREVKARLSIAHASAKGKAAAQAKEAQDKEAAAAKEAKADKGAKKADKGAKADEDSATDEAMEAGKPAPESASTEAEKPAIEAGKTDALEAAREAASAAIMDTTGATDTRAAADMEAEAKAGTAANADAAAEAEGEDEADQPPLKKAEVGS